MPRHLKAKPKPKAKPKKKPCKVASLYTQLKEGNQRFQKNKNYRIERSLTEHEQAPCWICVSCCDSRSVTALVFDQPHLGNVFEVRTAGNAISILDLESVKYAVRFLKPVLLLVLGHSSCGAIKASIQALEEPFSESGQETLELVPNLVKALTPAVRLGEQKQENKKENKLDACIRANVLLQTQKMHSIFSVSLKCQGAVYDIASGKIEWLD